MQIQNVKEPPITYQLDHEHDKKASESNEYENKPQTESEISKPHGESYDQGYLDDQGFTAGASHR